MKTIINTYLTKHDFNTIDNDEIKNKIKLTNLSINKIFNLYILNKYENPTKDYEYIYYAQYYKINNNINKMIEFYKLGIECNDIECMDNLARYYENIKEYDNMLKYYIMAIDNNCIHSMDNLALYYKDIMDYDNMIKYYLIGIEYNNINCMINLANYYKEINNNHNMLKYLHMAADIHNNKNAIINLYNYYSNINNLDKMKKYVIISNDYENMNNFITYCMDKKLYEECILMINKTNYYDKCKYTSIKCIKKIMKNSKIEDNILQIILNLDLTQFDNVPIYLKLLQNSYKIQIDIIDLHYKYSPGNDGAILAKKDYLHQLMK